jgi:hypothetical protein
VATYPTPTELAGYLQKDLDTYSATQALDLAAAEFEEVAGVRFESTAVTHEEAGSCAGHLVLPFSPIIAVSEIRIAGTAVTDYSRIGQMLYRAAGWGGGGFPPSLVEVDLTHGYTADRLDAKLAILEIAAGLYEHPDGSIVAESIDDYSVKYSGTPILPGRPWREVAEAYQGVFAA